MDTTFVIICRHRFSFIFPIDIKANHENEALAKFHTANMLINNQIVPTYYYEANTNNPKLDLVCGMSWNGSIPFPDFDTYLDDWLSLSLYHERARHVRALLRLERLRSGEVVRNKIRRGSKITVEIKTEEGLLSEIESTRQALYVGSDAQTFCESLGHAFDFAKTINAHLETSIARERDFLLRAREKRRVKI